MLYNSTRDNSVKVTSARAINNGISAEGGLFVPEQLPKISADELHALAEKPYVGRAAAVLKLFLSDFTDEEIADCVKGAYCGTFDNDEPAPLVAMPDGTHILELWHGPTCAFKDMALQLLPHLLTRSSVKTGDGKKTMILVATSGDTGKAALEGFKDVDNTGIMVFYPEHGVSRTQKLQMATQEGSNVFVCAINGNFDDAQSGVKRIFTDPDIRERLSEKGIAFSSANSINWGRLLPQIVYYVSVYCDLLNEKGEVGEFNVVVPTGNFGNILAAYYAKCMGVPIGKLICASNSNNVLTDFIKTGTYDRNRSFYTTISPSMDILISSNLERLLYHLSGRDSEQTAAYMRSLAESGRYTVSDSVREQVQSLFYGGCADDRATKATIHDLFEKEHYLCDTHTAVAVSVYNDYVKATGDRTPAVIVSTASPYKFASDVLDAVEAGAAEGLSGIEAMERLSEKTGTKIPAPLSGLADKKIRFEKVVEPADMDKAVFDCLGV